MIDVASARRGYHDAVVEGYLRVRQLEKSELDLLDVFWTAMVLETVWQVLSHETTWGPVHDQDLQWCKLQLEKLARTVADRACSSIARRGFRDDCDRTK